MTDAPSSPTDAPDPPAGAGTSPRPAIAAATVWCDNCGRSTVHRVLRLQPVRPGSSTVRGVARCRVCHWTHPFESTSPRPVRVDLVVSEQERSARRTLEVAPDLLLRVGTDLPGSPGLQIRRLDRRDRTSPEEGVARDLATVWAVARRPPGVAVSIMEGGRTRTARYESSPTEVLEVGTEIVVDGRDLTIVGLRARRRTWREPGDAFPLSEVDRVYARRADIPPAGRRDWSSERSIPRSAARATSTDARSRSSPGTRRYRTAPRERKDRSGATDQRSSSS